MDDSRTDAPDFELSTPKTDLSDALQAELSDSLSGFELEPESKPQHPPKPPRKPTPDDNDTVLAALLGKPLATKQPTTEKPAADEFVKITPASPKSAARDSILAAMLGKGVSTAPAAPVEQPQAPAAPLIAAKVETAKPQPIVEVPVSLPIIPAVPVVPPPQIYPKLVTDAEEEMEAIEVVEPAPPPKSKLFATPRAMPPATPFVESVPLFAPVPIERVVVIPPRASEPENDLPSPRTGAWWTLPLMFAGLAIVACAVLVPASDENRRAMYELAKIDRDVAYFQKQSDVNKDFLERVSNDPTLAERLALRQLHMTRADTHLMPVPTKTEPFSRSPFALVSVEPPPSLEPYHPVAGFLGEWFLNVRLQIYLAGIGVLMVAAGVILGGGEPTGESFVEE